MGLRGRSRTWPSMPIAASSRTLGRAAPKLRVARAAAIALLPCYPATLLRVARAAAIALRLPRRATAVTYRYIPLHTVTAATRDCRAWPSCRYGVSAEPETRALDVSSIERRQWSRPLLLLASDGVWDIWDFDEVCRSISRAATACARL